MVSRSGARVRRLIITAVIAGGLSAGVTGVALAATGGSAAATSTRGTTTTSVSSTTSSTSAGSSPATPAPSGTHHPCPHMSGSSGSTSS